MTFVDISVVTIYVRPGVTDMRKAINGFCLWHKRLERDRFPWPQSEEQIREFSGEQLKMLLDGIDFWHAHQKIWYSSMV